MTRDTDFAVEVGKAVDKATALEMFSRFCDLYSGKQEVWVDRVRYGYLVYVNVSKWARDNEVQEVLDAVAEFKAR